MREPANQPNDVSTLFKNGVWVIEDRTHEGMSIRLCDDGRCVLSAWAENWDDTWGWEAYVTPEEVAAVAADPSAARRLLQTERTWRVDPPSSVPGGSYTKQGCLDSRDGFSDGGTGGRA